VHIPQITLQSVWVEYVVSCKEAGVRAAQYSTFTALWRQLTPQIQVMKPMSDLCWVCQQNSRAIMKAANMPEEQKSQVEVIVKIEHNTFTYTHCVRNAPPDHQSG